LELQSFVDGVVGKFFPVLFCLHLCGCLQQVEKHTSLLPCSTPVQRKNFSYHGIEAFHLGLTKAN
jgi:hypothetical protein